MRTILSSFVVWTVLFGVTSGSAKETVRDTQPATDTYSGIGSSWSAAHFDDLSVERRKAVSPIHPLVISSDGAAGLKASHDEGLLERRGSELYLDGRPFYEISFNKFDLFWQFLAAEIPSTNVGPEGDKPADAAEVSLRDLSSLGFKTIRVFAAVPSVYLDPTKREKYVAATDRMMDACDRHGLRMVFCLCASDEHLWKDCGETLFDLVARADSKSRLRFQEMVRALVSRYRSRKTIAMWEHANELLLMADIGGKGRVWNGEKCPSLAEVARFHTESAAFIRNLDARHLITTGDSFRYSQWHLAQAAAGDGKDMWMLDSLQELNRAVGMAQKGVDVFCVHNYNYGAHGENQVQGPAGKPVPCRPADIKRFTTAAGQPLYFGEYGAAPQAHNETTRKFWTENPQWFTSYVDDQADARRIVAESLQAVVEAKANLTHWWTYQSHRTMDQNDPQRFDIDIHRTPKLVRLVVEANRRLQMATMGFTYAK